MTQEFSAPHDGESSKLPEHSEHFSGTLKILTEAGVDNEAAEDMVASVASELKGAGLTDPQLQTTVNALSNYTRKVLEHTQVTPANLEANESDPEEHRVNTADEAEELLSERPGSYLETLRFFLQGRGGYIQEALSHGGEKLPPDEVRTLLKGGNLQFLPTAAIELATNYEQSLVGINQAIPVELDLRKQENQTPVLRHFGILARNLKYPTRPNLLYMMSMLPNDPLAEYVESHPEFLLDTLLKVNHEDFTLDSELAIPDGFKDRGFTLVTLRNYS